MKNFRLIISIVIILTLVCSPALAISKADLITSYIVKPYSDPITCCDDCTPQTWWKGTVIPLTPGECGRWGVPVEHYDPPGPADAVPVPLSSYGGHCPESLPVTWYSKVATRLSLF